MQGWVEIRQSPPAGDADATQAALRGTKYREAGLQVYGPALHPLADNAQYFTATRWNNPGTTEALTAAAQSAFSATQAIFTLQNFGGEGQWLILPDFIRINFSTAGTGGTRTEVAVAVDTARYPTTLSDGLMISSPNADDGFTSRAVANRAALTLQAATSAVRYLYRGTLSSANITVGESYLISFGGKHEQALAERTLNIGPVALGHRDILILHLWRPGQTAAPNGFISAGWWEI